MATGKYVYTNYKKYSVRYDLEANAFDLMIDGRGWVVRNAKVTAVTTQKGARYALSDFAAPRAAVGGAASFFGGEDLSSLSVVYDGAGASGRDVVVGFVLSDAGIQFSVGGDSSANYEVAGELHWGDHAQIETMAVCINRVGDDFRVASGPATTAADNALFDRDTDAALKFDTKGKLRLKYDWERESYRFSFENEYSCFGNAFTMTTQEHVYEDVVHMPYKKMNPNSTFKTPPVGWMSWYAVQFAASEQTVMENAKFQEKYLKKYGADTVWVDWEWYHRDFSGQGDADVDMFHPDPITYPNGLKKVAGRIEELGFTPALWVGPTNDPTENEMVKKHPEAIISIKPDWCGQYWFDVTHPAFLNEVLPRMLNQPKDWGYKAIKWDCLPSTHLLMDRVQDRMYENGISSREAMSRMFRKAREIMGEDFYMLYCCALSQREIDLACEVFDGARIGGDIFRWDEFLTFLVDKLYKYYSLHNVVMLNDPDNVVIRDKFNSMDQARTRAAIVSIMGLPFTFGDNLPDLQPERVEVLRRSIPPIPHAHPMDIRTGCSNRREMKINLAVERPFGSWNVVDLVNLAEENVDIELDFARDLHLDVDGNEYFVYDFWEGSSYSVKNGRLVLPMAPCASRILSVVKKLDRPVVVSTSRHIAHGAIDIKDVKWDAAAKVLSGVSAVVGGDDYSIIVATPDPALTPAQCSNATTTPEIAGVGNGMFKLTWKNPAEGELDWSIGFWKGVSQD